MKLSHSYVVGVNAAGMTARQVNVPVIREVIEYLGDKTQNASLFAFDVDHRIAFAIRTAPQPVRQERTPEHLWLDHVEPFLWNVLKLRMQID